MLFITGQINALEKEKTNDFRCLRRRRWKSKSWIKIMNQFIL